MIAHAISKRIRGKRKLGIDPFSKEVPPIIEDTTKHIESVGKYICVNLLIIERLNSNCSI